MEELSVPILLGVMAIFAIYGIGVAIRRKDDFWEDKPKGEKRGRGARDRSPR